MDDRELEELLSDLESDRVERTRSAADTDKLCEAVCAFANDLPNHQAPGVLFIGVDDSGDCVQLAITDELLRNLGGIRSDGNVLPTPTMVVQKRLLRGCELAVIIVEPSHAPPVRHKGRTYIRVGPRRAVASVEEERRLSEKRKARDLPFDLHPVTPAQTADLDRGLVADYLSSAVAGDVLDMNDRSFEDQLLGMRFLSSMQQGRPTVLGLLVASRSPSDFIPGAYIQFVRYDGTELTDSIPSQREIHGPLAQLLNEAEELLKVNIATASEIVSQPREARFPDYPLVALQQTLRNAVMHRAYDATNSPVRINWFRDRIEIQNPGGPFGVVNRDNFGRGITDYRNPHLAEAMKNLGYVQRFGVGIPLAQKAMQENGNPPPEFQVEGAHVAVILRRR